MKDTIIIMAKNESEQIVQCYRDYEDLVNNLGSAYTIHNSSYASGKRKIEVYKDGKPYFTAREFSMFDAISTAIRLSNNTHYQQRKENIERARP